MALEGLAIIGHDHAAITRVAIVRCLKAHAPASSLSLPDDLGHIEEGDDREANGPGGRGDHE